MSPGEISVSQVTVSWTSNGEEAWEPGNIEFRTAKETNVLIFMFSVHTTVWVISLGDKSPAPIFLLNDLRLLDFAHAINNTVPSKC